MSVNLKYFTDLAVAQQCKIYGEIMAELKIEGVPNEQEFYDLVQEKVYGQGLSYNMGFAKQLPDEALASSPRFPDNRAGVSNFKLTSKDIKSKPLIHKTVSTDENGIVTESSVTLDFPFLHGVDYSTTCQSIKCSGGLLTPCLTRPAKGSNFCKGCVKTDRHGQTFLGKYGTVESRQNCSMLCYTDTNGKKEIGFGTYCAKRGVTRAQAEELIRSAFGDNVVLPEEYWKIDKSKASRAVKKTVSVSSDDEASVSQEPEKASVSQEPEKASVSQEPQEASVSQEPEEASVSQETAEVISALDASSNDGSVSDNSSSKKRRGRPKKTVEPKKEGDSPKKGRGRPKKTNCVVVEASTPNKEEPVASDGNDSENEFKQVTWEGKIYSIDEENTMFYMVDDEPELFGTWDPETKTATPIE